MRKKLSRSGNSLALVIDKPLLEVLGIDVRRGLQAPRRVSKPTFLALEEVLALHADQIRRYGGRPGIRDLELLKSALGMPEASYCGAYLHPSAVEMAAAYLFHIVRNHPFVDGNQRVGLIAALRKTNVGNLTPAGPLRG